MNDPYCPRCKRELTSTSSALVSHKWFCSRCNEVYSLSEYCAPLHKRDSAKGKKVGDIRRILRSYSMSRLQDEADENFWRDLAIAEQALCEKTIEYIEETCLTERRSTIAMERW